MTNMMNGGILNANGRCCKPRAPCNWKSQFISFYKHLQALIIGRCNVYDIHSL